MIRGLLIGTLALMSSTTSQTPGGEPDDPYQWLEEVMGEKPLAWVKERNAESIGELTGPSNSARSISRILEILDSDARIPAIQKIGPLLLQLLARRQEPARALAAHHARRVHEGQARTGKSCSISTPSARKRRKLGLARGPGAQARVQAGPRVAVARGRRRERGSRIRPDHQVVRQGRIHACPRPRARSPGADLTACSSAPTSARAR